MKSEWFKHVMDQAQAGDEEAAAGLFVHAYRPLRTLVRGLMDDVLARARLEPDDILQEVYVAAWSRLRTSRFDGFPAFVGWLKAIARNKAIDLRRGLLAEKHDVNRQVEPAGIDGSSYADLVERVVYADASPSREAARHEASAILAAQMWRLPEDYRRVLQWRFVQGLAVAEVAKRLDRTEPAVHTLCHRALKKLRALMGSPSKYLSTVT